MRRYLFLTLYIFGMLFIFTTINSIVTTQAHNKKFTSGSARELQLAEHKSFEYLTGFTPGYGIDSAKDLKVSKVEIDELSMAHTRLQQTYQGIPVFGGETIVHLNSDGSLFDITDALVANISVNAQADLSADEAVERATSLLGCNDCLSETPKADMMVLRHNGKDHLVYRVQLKRLGQNEQPAMPIYFIDAHTGKKVWDYDNLQRIGFPFITRHYGKQLVEMETNLFFNQFEHICIFKPSVRTSAATSSARRAAIYSYNFKDIYPEDETIKTCADVGLGMNFTTRYFRLTHNRNGMDGNYGPSPYPIPFDPNDSRYGEPMAVILNEHADLVTDDPTQDSGVNNSGGLEAYWNGQELVIGLIESDIRYPASSIDVIGHEFTHGLIQFTAGLNYSGETGALNESFADVFGTMIERYGSNSPAASDAEPIEWNWKIGEKCFTPNIDNDAIRYMDDPHLSNDPDHYSERFTGIGDNRGVHTNCSIPNKVFYLLSEGGTHHKGGSMTGIGADKAAQIWYKALTRYMTSNTNFAGARTATVNAARELFGNFSPEVTAVGKAWGLCGVGSFEGINNGSFETTLAPWSAEGSGIQYDNNSSLVVDGKGEVSLANGSANTVINGKIYQEITVPATVISANLSFYFGGSTAETASAGINDKLYAEICNQSGTVLQTLATYSNKDLGPIGPSFKKKGNFNLLAYKGQTIRLQFRTETNTTAATSFDIDAVSLTLTN